MLYLIGAGLFDEKDISLHGLEKLRESDFVYIELYTGFLHADLKKLEALCGREIKTLARKDIEERPEENVLRDAEHKTVSLLVPGDPMVATTHVDLLLRAKKRGIKTEVIHSSSIYSAVAETGLQVYKFGRTTTIAYPEGNYFPESPFDVVRENLERGLHTLCLLDVKADQSRYMTVNEGIRILLDIAVRRNDPLFNEKTPCVGIARLGGDATIKYGPAKEVMKLDFGGPPHALIIPGRLHYMEEEALKAFSD